MRGPGTRSRPGLNTPDGTPADNVVCGALPPATAVNSWSTLAREARSATRGGEWRFSPRRRRLLLESVLDGAGAAWRKRHPTYDAQRVSTSRQVVVVLRAVTPRGSRRRTENLTRLFPDDCREMLTRPGSASCCSRTIFKADWTEEPDGGDVELPVLRMPRGGVLRTLDRADPGDPDPGDSSPPAADATTTGGDSAPPPRTIATAWLTARAITPAVACRSGATR